MQAIAATGTSQGSRGIAAVSAASRRGSAPAPYSGERSGSSRGSAKRVASPAAARPETLKQATCASPTTPVSRNAR